MTKKNEKLSSAVSILHETLKPVQRKESPAKHIRLVDSTLDSQPIAVEVSTERMSLVKRFAHSFTGSDFTESFPRLYVSVKGVERERQKNSSLPLHVLVPVDNMPWYTKSGDIQKGPMDAQSLEKAYIERELDDEALVRKDGMSSWVPLKNCLELIGLIVLLELRDTSREVSLKPLRAVKRALKNNLEKTKGPTSKLGKLITFFQKRRHSEIKASQFDGVYATEELDRATQEFRDEVDTCREDPLGLTTEPTKPAGNPAETTAAEQESKLEPEQSGPSEEQAQQDEQATPAVEEQPVQNESPEPEMDEPLQEDELSVSVVEETSRQDEQPEPKPQEQPEPETDDVSKEGKPRG